MVSIRPPTPARAATGQARSPLSIRVQKGDTVIGLARLLGVSPSELAEVNALVSPDRIVAGRSLRVPASAVIVIRAGDTLSALAARFSMSASALARINQLPDPNRLFIGQRLRLHVPGILRDSQRVSVQAEQPEGPVDAHASTSSFARMLVEHVVDTPLAAQAKPGPAGWTPGQQLRAASAGISTAENLVRLRNSLGTRLPAALGVAGAVVAAVRLDGDLHTLVNDLEADGVGARSIESAAKAARNSVRVAGGVEHIALAFGKSVLAHEIPGAAQVSAALDATVAVATAADADASAAEKRLATLSAALSLVAASEIPIVAQLAGIAASGFGVWRDFYSDDRRLRTRTK